MSGSVGSTKCVVEVADAATGTAVVSELYAKQAQAAGHVRRAMTRP